MAGITLYNAGKMKEAVEPLKKATELDPKSAQSVVSAGRIAGRLHGLQTSRQQVGSSGAAGGLWRLIRKP